MKTSLLKVFAFQYDPLIAEMKQKAPTLYKKWLRFSEVRKIMVLDKIAERKGM